MAALPLTFVLTENFSYLSLAILLDGFRVANRLSGAHPFEAMIISETGTPVASSSGVTVSPQMRLDQVDHAPIAIVLSAYEPEAACTPGLIAWLRQQDRKGAILGCVDTGALVLARAGLIRNTPVAVHPEVVRPFREEIGDAVLVDRRFAFERRRLSSAGGFATMDMVLAVIEQYQGRPLAQQTADVLMFDRPGTAFAAPANTAMGPTGLDPRLGRLIAAMQEHVEEPMAVDALCRGVGVDSSTARRLFKRHTGDSPQAYYTKLRLERGRTLLRYSHLSVSQIAISTGFADAPSFSRAFKRVFGSAPSQARQDAAGVLT